MTAIISQQLRWPMSAAKHAANKKEATLYIFLTLRTYLHNNDLI